MAFGAFRDGRAWRALHRRNYRLFFGGQLISLIGTWMQTVAEAWLVLLLSNDPFVLGLVSAVRFLPVLALGLFGGIVADNLPKRQTLIVTQVAQMVLAFISFALVQTGVVQVWQIVVLAFLLGVANAVDMPVRQSFVVEMVGREDVANAVALNSAVFNGARVIGPAIAGILMGWLGVAMCFLLNGLSFVAVIAGLLLMRDSELRLPARAPRPASVRAVGENLVEGLRYVRATPAVALPIAVVGLISTFAINFGVSVPDMVREGLHSDATGYGFMMAATGIGSFLAAVAIAGASRASSTTLLGGALVLAVAFTVFGMSPWFAVSLVAMAVCGAGMIAMAATANTIIQLTVPDRLRGRVMSVYTTVFAGSTPVGGLATGTLASTYGIAATIVLTGGLSILVALGALAYAARHPRALVAAAVVTPA